MTDEHFSNLRAEMGGLFTREEVNLNFFKMITRFGTNRVFSHYLKASSDEDEFVKDIEKFHNLEKGYGIEKDFRDHIKIGSTYAHKVLERQEILFRMHVNHLFELLRHEQDMFTGDKEYLKKIEKHFDKRKDDHTKIGELIEKVEKEDEEVHKRLHSELQDCLTLEEKEVSELRQVLHSVEKIAQGDTGVKLWTKDTPEGFVKRFLMRRDETKEANAEKLAEKDESEFQDMEKELHEALKRIYLYIKKHDIGAVHDELNPSTKSEKNKVSKDVKIAEEEISEIKVLITKIITQVKKFLGKIYRIMVFDLLLIKGFLLLAESNNEEVKEFLADNYIPQMFGRENIEELQQDKENIKKELFGSETFIKQIFSLDEKAMDLAKKF